MPENLDILLVNIGGTKKKVYQELSKDFSAVEPPFWTALTAGFIRNKGYVVDILDASVENLDIKETADAIKKRNPKLTAIVVYGQQANTCAPLMTAVGQLCREIKEQEQDRKVILTGWHPSALPKRTMENEVCDFVAVGEGFYTLLGLLENKNYEEIPGLWWRSKGKMFNNPRAKNVEDLTSELSDIAWDLLPLDSGRYKAFNWMSLGDLESRHRYASMFTSLGCPYKCTFCAIHTTFGERRIRYWSPQWVLKQIDILVKQYGVKHINFIDELFVFNQKHFLPIAEGLIERNYDLNICAFARVDVVDATEKEKLEKLKKAGFNWFKLGIESASTDVLKKASKGCYNKDGIKRVVEKIHDAGINLCANFMFGLPGDTMETMQETLDIALELNCAFPSFFCAMATPGSDLYTEAIQKGMELPDSWVGYAQQGYDFLPLSTEVLSAAEVLKFRDDAFDTYFKAPRYLAMIEEKFGSSAKEHIENMTKIKLKRKILGD